MVIKWFEDLDFLTYNLIDTTLYLHTLRSFVDQRFLFNQEICGFIFENEFRRF